MKNTSTRDQVDETRSIASSFSAERIDLAAGNDITVKGSNVVASNDVTLSAQNNIAIEAATDTLKQSNLKVEKTSGLFGTGGIGITLGSRELSVDNQGTSTTAAAATVGSTDGNVAINAGKNFKQVGSSLAAPAGDIDVTAQKVDILAAQDKARSTTETKFTQSGLTLSLTSPVISAIQTAQQQAQASKDTKSGRLKALAAANTALAGRNAVKAIEAGQGTTIGGKDNQVLSTNLDGTTARDANAADQAGGVNLSISIGGSQSKSKTVQNSSTAQGSSVAAGRDINISATGAGAASDLTVQGSTLNAGRDIKLKADNDIKLLAAQSTADQKSTNSSIAASVGISIGTSGFGVTVSASGARGKADGNDVTQSNTQVVAGNQIALESGRDTTLKGAVASSEQVTVKVGRDLNIESLQDTSQFASRQQSIGASVTIGAGAGGSFSASKSTVNSDFASVAQQSGIRAGDGGFDVQVTGNTDLKGGAITSTQAAVDQNLNRFETDSLTLSDIQNKASFKGKAIGVSAGTSANNLGGALKPSGTSIGFGKDSGNAGSTTQAAISGIAGNTAARTGDKETGIQKIFDADKVQKEIDAQVIITQTFGREAPKAAADFAVSRSKDLQVQAAQAEKAGDSTKQAALLAEAKQWEEGGAYRIALQAAVGGLGGGVSGALGAGAAAAAAPVLDELQNSIAQKLKDAGASDAVANLAGQAVSLTAAAGIGAAAGGGNVAGVAGGFNVDANNRQLHPTEIALIKQNAKRYAQRRGVSEQEAERILAQQAYRQVQFGVAGEFDKDASNFLRSLGTGLLPADPNFPNSGPGALFFANPEQKSNPALYASTLTTNADFYRKNNLNLPSPQQVQSAAERDGQIRDKAATATKVGAAAITTAVLAPIAVTACLSNPVACNQAGITAAGVLSEGGVVAGGAVGAKKVVDEVGKFTGRFETLGLSRDPATFPDGIKLIRELEKNRVIRGGGSDSSREVNSYRKDPASSTSHRHY